MKKSVTYIALACLCWGVQSNAGEDIHWTYTGERGSANWGALSEEFAACRVGKNQSPIDIRTENVIETELPPMHIEYKGDTSSIVNNGHTLQVNVSGDNILSVDGQKFKLLQFHFHSPSEHQIDGEAFPLEAHFVHENERGELAVIGILFRLGEENQNIYNIGKSAPEKAGEETRFVYAVDEIMVVPAKDISAYYRYSGSLTTPPCTEGLRWFVVPEAVTISSEQVSRYIELIGEDARGPQPVNARLVLHGK